MQVYDARALRVIVDDESGTRVRDAVETVYKLVSVVHSIWKPIPQVTRACLTCGCCVYVESLSDAWVRVD